MHALLGFMNIGRWQCSILRHPLYLIIPDPLTAVTQQKSPRLIEVLMPEHMKITTIFPVCMGNWLSKFNHR